MNAIISNILKSFIYNKQSFEICYKIGLGTLHHLAEPSKRINKILKFDKILEFN